VTVVVAVAELFELFGSAGEAAVAANVSVTVPF
jgi:hypothetical protein